MKLKFCLDTTFLTSSFIFIHFFSLYATCTTTSLIATGSMESRYVFEKMYNENTVKKPTYFRPLDCLIKLLHKQLY